MRLFSTSSASASLCVTVISAPAICETIIAVRGLACDFWKYDDTRFLRSPALPT
jgi:hypothetical protein